MPSKPIAAKSPALRKQTTEWVTTRTIPSVKAIARDLENAGEDVRDLLAAIDDLERLLRNGPATKRRPHAERHV